jgi:hypothetical protein
VLKPSAIRQRIAAAIVDALGSSPTGAFTESRHPWDRFPATLDGREMQHHAFAVGVPTSGPWELDRQRAENGTPMTTQVSVRWSRVLRVQAVVSDYDAALDDEAELVAAIVATDRNPDMGIRFVRVETRAVTPDGLAFLGELLFDVFHRYPLST